MAHRRRRSADPKNARQSVIADQFGQTLLATMLAVGCGGQQQSLADLPASAPVDQITAELSAISRPVVALQDETYREILASALAKDSFLGWPLPREVFFGDGGEGERVISGLMPHYGFFQGPMHYLIQRREGRWFVQVRIALEIPTGLDVLELADCGLAEQLGVAGDALEPCRDSFRATSASLPTQTCRLPGGVGLMHCAGIPYTQSGSTDACPDSGTFWVTATPETVRALLSRWSTEAEKYWTRDARIFGLPITYDFEFLLASEVHDPSERIDMYVPLEPTCGRTPYFSAFRSGWSLPVVAHEVGHVMGLLDEYEMFSGIVGFYPKTPFPGAEISRMGLSMKEETRVLPIHHYLVLRRYFCAQPHTVDPYQHAL